MSFKETKANYLIAAESPDHLDLITLTQKHLVRVYPGSLRQNSSNVHPLFYWTYGKLTYLNFKNKQTFLFRSSNGCIKLSIK